MKRVTLWHRGPAWLFLGAVLLVLPLLAGCGQLNDNPAQGVTVKVNLQNLASSATSQPALAGPPASCTYVECTEVKTVVLGAVVITHRDTPYTDEDQVDSTAESDIEDDLVNSVVYFDVVPVDGLAEPVPFVLPPESAGSWMVLAVGLRDRISTLGELEDLPNDSPIWFGFTYAGPDGQPRTYNPDNPLDPSQARFLNDLVKPGDTIPLTLQPACGYTDNGLANLPAGQSSCSSGI